MVCLILIVNNLFNFFSSPETEKIKNNIKDNVMIGPEYVVPYVNEWEIILRIGVRSEEILKSSFVMYSKEKRFDPELLKQFGKIERREHMIND